MYTPLDNACYNTDNKTIYNKNRTVYNDDVNNDNCGNGNNANCAKSVDDVNIAYYTTE